MFRRWTLVSVGFLGLASPAAAELPPLIPREILFGNPEKSNPQISPDGSHLAYLAPDRRGVLQLWLRTLGKDDDRRLTRDPRRGVRSYTWASNSEQLIALRDSDGDENFHLISLNIKDNVFRDLTPFVGIRAELIDIDPCSPQEILVGMNLKDRRKFDAYRINLVTGGVELDTINPGNIVHWTADAKFQIRAALASTPDGGSDLLIRTSSRSKWEKVRHWNAEDQGTPLVFSENGKILYLLANHDANALRLLALDLETRKEKVLAEDPIYDVGNVMFHPTRRTVQGITFNKEKLVRKAMDPSIAEDLKILARVRKGQYRLFHRDDADKTWLVGYVNDDGPIYYYAYDREKKKATLLFNHQPKLENLALASMKPISYQARDGLPIHGYLTTPVGIPARNLPTVVLVHGGPWERDSWGFEPVVQWLANRGYAVLQVNYRGSMGYGKKFMNAGNREWGGKMSLDLVDGVNHLIKNGIADPRKVAIMGGSYGGYATLAGLTFQSDIYAAGVDIVGPSNLITMLRSLPLYWEPIREKWTKRVGSVDKDAEFLKSRSPLFFVDRIKAPLLIGQGANDPRVKKAESDQIVEALRRVKKTVEYIVYSDEGHGFTRPENRLHFFAHAEAFLARHLGGRSEPLGDIKGHSGVVQ